MHLKDERTMPVLTTMAPLIIWFAYLIAFTIAMAVWNIRRSRGRPNPLTASADEMIRYWAPYLIVVQVCAWFGILVFVVAIAQTTNLLNGPGGQPVFDAFLVSLLLLPILFAVFDLAWMRRVRAGRHRAPLPVMAPSDWERP